LELKETRLLGKESLAVQGSTGVSKQWILQDFKQIGMCVQFAQEHLSKMERCVLMFYFAGILFVPRIFKQCAGTEYLCLVQFVTVILA